MKQLDKKWLLNAADDLISKNWIDRIVECHEYVKKNNTFLESDENFFISILGNKIFLTLNSSFSAIEVFCEVFKENEHLKLKNFMPDYPSLIFDIGANQGFFSLKLKKIYPKSKIISIEPNPYEFRKLQKNIIINGYSDEIDIENIAVADVTGSINMEIIPEIGAIGGKNIKIPERPWMRDEFIKEINVPSISLNDLFDKYSIAGYVDLVKIDVEGYELDILKHARVFNQIERFVIEYHSKEIKKQLISLLESKNFVLQYDDSDLDAYYGDLYFKNKNLIT